MSLQYFAGTSSGTQWVYDDDGKNPLALHQPQSHQLIVLEAKQEGKKHTITIKAKNWPKGSKRELHIQPVGLVGAEYKVKINNGKTQESQVRLKPVTLEFNGEPITILLEE